MRPFKTDGAAWYCESHRPLGKRTKEGILARPSLTLSDPLVSVGIPTYRRPVELRRTLNSICGQTYRNLEIIVSDNGTPGDEVTKILQEYAGRDSRIRYFIQPHNLGAVRNFQYVLENATGDYFMWCGDDDWYEPELIEVLSGLLIDRPDASLAFCDFSERDENGRPMDEYSEHLAPLKELCSPSLFIRQLRYFWQRESRGKANLLCGLIPRRHLIGYSWDRFTENQIERGADMLFVFWLLTKGRLVISERHLFGCSVGNTKHYLAKDQRTNKGLRFLIRSATHSVYLYNYLRLAKGPAILAISLLIVPKLILDRARALVASLCRHATTYFFRGAAG